MQETWKPTTAGILSIIAGTIGMITGIIVAILGIIIGPLFGVAWGAFSVYLR